MKGFNFIRRMGKLQNNAETPAESGVKDVHEEGKPRRRWRYWIMASAGLALLTVIGINAEKKYVTANTESFYRVMLHDKEIGTIRDAEELSVLFEKKRQEYQTKYPGALMVVQTEGITTKPDRAYKPTVESEATLKKLDGMLKAYAVGVQLMVNGKAVGIVKDQETANAVLQGVKQHYVPETEGSQGAQLKRTAASGAAASTASKSSPELVESAKIREQVTIEPTKADPNKVLNIEEAVKVLTEGKDAPLLYEVQEGDTISAIAKRFGITQADIFRNNPEVKELTLQIGDELQLTVPQPELTVVTVEKVSEQIVTEPEVVVRTSDLLEAGKSKVVRPGQTGLKEMQYRLTKENGTVVREEWLGQTVLKASLPEVVYRGTKVAMQASGTKAASQASGTKVIGQASGMFAWPVSGATISSSFGERWGRAHKGVDLVSGNRSIKASDAGTVSFAGVQSGYGNVVIINHNNGYETYYGHLSSISVSQGQRLEQGAKIGVMGSTGRSTGTHLHFEIRKNGSALNPMKYLK
ncbi:M23 family metallopeptidase [Paenibacillus agri]|uniref:M23 family metallopeptidase n=1 Tax=Paenibacillus agri TaxID=2744309 RepID=A0A850EW40_9BACL|nr:M23 family metallopeptidase [Paenibacillus agri]NUU63082.1 M23 family metallopeptidase [Paenibacillus agri]